MRNPLSGLDLRWLFTLLITLLVATAAGLGLGLWLGS